MSAPRPHLIITEKKENSPILIIDKNGTIGEALLEQLKDQFHIILATGKQIKPQHKYRHIHFGDKIPNLPDIKYSTILTIYQGEKNTLEILKPVAKKAYQDNTKNIFVTSITLEDKNLKKLLSSKEFEKTHEIFYGEIFGKEYFQENALTQYIHQFRTQQSIEISGNGLQKAYPVHFEDVCNAIITIAFAQTKSPKTTLVLPKHGFTHLAIARAFQKLNPLIKVNFRKEKFKSQAYFIQPNAQYFFSNYPLEEKLKKTDLSKIKLSKKNSPNIFSSRQNAHFANNFPGDKKTRHKLTLLSLAILFFVLPIILQLLLLLAGGVFLVESFNNLRKNNMSFAKNYNLFSKYAFSASGFISKNMSGLSPILMTYKEPIYQKSQAGLMLAEVEGDLLDSAIIMKNIYENNTHDSKNEFQQVIAKIKNSMVTIQRLQAGGNLPESIEAEVKKVQYPLILLGNTIDIMPELLGFNQKKKYLILFQNNMELRPGGGFIGSYAVVEINNAKPGKLIIQDVYDADGQLSTHIEPPFALRRYLGAPHLFLRDSNFEVDFIANARKAKSFLELETGEKVDGVIAIDTEFVRQLIAVVGPLEIKDYNKTVTEDNFYLLTQTHAEKDFFPGSTQKKDFLRAVYNALESKVVENENIPLDILVQKISDALRQKHLLLAMPDSIYQDLFTVNNLSSSIQESRKPQTNEFLDFVGINEANLGMNKANAYIKRAVEHNVTIEENGSAKEKITITYENTGNKQTPYGGDYKNFIRFILPEKAVLESVEINGNTVATTSAITQPAEFTRKEFVPPTQLEVEKSSSNGRTLYGFLTLIPMQTSQKISINYSLKSIIDTSRIAFKYNLRIHKQPGTYKDPYLVTIKYPAKFQPRPEQNGFSNVGGKLIREYELNEDKKLVVTFTQK